MKIAVLSLVVGIGALLWGTGVISDIVENDFETVLRDAGLLGPVLYVVLFSLLEPFGVLGLLFVAPGSLVWDWPTLFLLSWAGAVGAGIVGFAFARTVGREWVQRHLPEQARRFDERLARRGFSTVVLVRMTFFLWPPAHWALGLSQVRFGPFLAGSTVGFALPMAGFTYVGKGVVDLLGTQSVGGWAVVAMVGMLGAAAWKARQTAS